MPPAAPRGVLQPELKASRRSSSRRPAVEPKATRCPSLDETFHSCSCCCSQPAAVCSFEYSSSLSMDHHDAPDVATDGSDLPPRRAHRRSRSEVPFAFLPPLPLVPSDGAGVKMESHDGVAGDDLFDGFMDLDGFDMLNSSEDNHSRDSGSRMNATENETKSNASLRAMAKQGGADHPGRVTVVSRHCRSLSMDSFTGRFHFEEEPSKLQRPCREFRSESSARVDCPDTKPNAFILEFGHGQFTAPDMKKIMENEKLVELAMADPKRVKRILANAARLKERKMRYIEELEHKVQALQTETTTLSAQLTLLQRDSTGLINKNNELKFRLQSMKQQSQLRDALNEALTIEVQRLKLAASGLEDAHDLSDYNHHAPLNARAMDFREEQ